MDLRLEESEETELNMTPMIDIVFQLIIFFLLSLKFKTIDRRIDSMLPNRGEAMEPSFPPDEQKIKLKAFRRELASSEQAYTLIKLDNAMQFRLPGGWKGRLKESPARVERYDGVMAAIAAAVAERVSAYGGVADAIKGEVVAPPPTGGAVPHGDVIAMVNAFIDAGITNVNFEGAAQPLTRRERAQRASTRR